MDPRTQNLSIIADARRSTIAVGVLALAAGALVAAYYAGQHLTLSHYDAKAHLVVARRILDGLNPGWVQIGAVWLPLPHLLNMLPVQIDAFYRTGLSGVVISILAFGVSAMALFRLIRWATGSALAAFTGLVAFASNPDVLYLQSTPMTEPLLMALVAASVWLSIDALDDAPADDGEPGAAQRRTSSPRLSHDTRVRLAGFTTAAACMTRYEAWPVTGALLVLGTLALVLRGVSWREALRRVGAIAKYPVWAGLAFLVLGWASTGAWFTTGGFFVPENVATGRPVKAVLSVWWGVHELTSYGLAIAAAAGFCLALWSVARDRRRGFLLVALAIAAAGALPAYAFYSGHPFRIRYMIPLIPSVGLGLGLFVGLMRGRWRVAAALVAWALLLMGPRPLAADAPMVLEAQWDQPNRAARQAVTDYLRAHWDHELIMVSMGSLAHYMQELSSAGFEIRDFLHEGNGEIWEAALDRPGDHVEWLLMEERAEGGDMLAQRARAHPRYLEGFVRVAEGGGVALYHRIKNGT